MKYITELQKKEIDKKYFPNGFLYTVKTFNTQSYSNSKRCDEPFETLQEYERTVKRIRRTNALRFFSHLKNMNETDFIKEINHQFLDYTLENSKHSELWLSSTYDLVLKGFYIGGKIENINLRGAFIEWHKLKVSELTKQPQQQEIKEPKGVIHKISVNNFKELYFVNLDRYLIESEKILEITEKIIYWKTNKYDYKKLYIELSSENPLSKTKLLIGTVGLGALENNPFEKLCDTQIELLELETEYQTSIKKQPQQIETNKPDEVKKDLHSNIFKGNSIYLFEKYLENKSMNFQSRTDFRFLFEQMKEVDSLIHDTVSLAQYIKFIGKYGYNEKELKSITMDTLKNIQRTKDYNEYKDNLEMTLK